MTKTKYDNYTKEELIKEVSSLKKRKKYGLVWDEEREPEKVVLECREKLPILEEMQNKEIIADKNQPTNILIEGDNYHALAVLNYTHKGKIDVIYIDPPYNTGNEGFVYNDKIVNREDTYRHSKWLSFISKRLLLARNLLSDSGVIFISIDDNEFAQLKLLCDKLFGENNHIITITVKRSSAAGHKTINPTPVNVVEYILAYAKNKSKWIYTPQYVECDYSDMYNNFVENVDDPIDKWKICRLNEAVANSLGFKDVKTAQQKLRKAFREEIADFALEHANAVFQYTAINYSGVGKNIQEIYNLSQKNPDKIYQIKRSNRPDIYIKDRNRLTFYYPTKVRKINGKLTPTELLTNIWTDIGWHGIASEGKVTFNKGKKPIKLIKRIINLSTTKKDATILDFFAGSGTTGEAVLELNKEDAGKRTYLICTNNEGNPPICEEVCYPRIKEVSNRFKSNIKYFKTGFVGASPTDKNKRDLVEKCTEMICLRENSFELIKKGIEFKIFKGSEKYLGIIYDEDAIEEFKKEAKEIDGKFNVYVFSLDQYAHNDKFKEMKNKVKLNPIPEVILAVYRRIFK